MTRRRTKAREGDLVIVEWTDSASTDSWMRLQDARQQENDGLIHCRSVGWLTKLSPKAMTVHGSETPTQVMATISIPRSCIVKIERLRTREA